MEGAGDARGSVHLALRPDPLVERRFAPDSPNVGLSVVLAVSAFL